MAAARAIASHDPDPTVRNPDWLAERLIGPAERALIAPHPIANALDQPYAEALSSPEVAGLTRLMLARTRFIDEHLLEAVGRGVRQIVLLGAGFDTRAYRFRELLAHTRVFEIDAPATQEYKKRRIQEVLGAPPPNVVYAPIDFRTDRLFDVSRHAGCDPAVESFFVWEGVSMYVDEAAVLETLSAIARCSAPGSSLVMDYAAAESIEALRGEGPPASQLQFAAAWGEPWIFGIRSGGEREFFERAGFIAVKTLRLTGDEATARYVRRRDGTVVGELRDGWKNQGARAGYAIAELRLQSQQ